MHISPCRKIGSSAAFLETVAVNVSTVSESPGAIGADCSVVNVSRIGVDYCDLNVRLDFTKTVKHSVSIELFDDSVPERDEVVKIVLSQPQGCLVPKWLSRKIFIHDSEDCKLWPLILPCVNYTHSHMACHPMLYCIAEVPIYRC